MIKQINELFTLQCPLDGQSLSKSNEKSLSDVPPRSVAEDFLICY